MKIYKNLGIYPNPKLCPENHMNLYLWKEFAMSKIKKYEYREEKLQLILNHIKILCNHQQNVFEYFCKWLGQMLAFLHIKPGIAITLISLEGSGKGY